MKEEEKDNECKVIMLGESGVGKTCIMERFSRNIFDKKQISTIGASYIDKTLKLEYNNHQEEIKLLIWDTAGEERFRSLTRNFYSNAKIVILVYDITCKDTFDAIREYWYKEIIEYFSKDNVIVAIAGNKIDDFLKEEVNEDEARQFATDNNFIFAHTSALSGDGINELFKDVGTQYLKKMIEERNKEGKNNKNKENKQVDLEGGQDKKNKKGKCCKNY